MSRSLVLPPRNILIFTGIGDKTFGQTDVGRLIVALKQKILAKNSPSKIYTIGDERNGISSRQFYDEMKAVAADSSDDISIIAYSHASRIRDQQGAVTDMKFLLGQDYITSRDFLTAIRDSFGERKTDILSLSCVGNMLPRHADLLARDSAIISLINSQELMHDEIIDFVEALESCKYLKDFSSFSLLEAYLFFGLKSNMMPLVAVSGFKEVDLRQNLLEKLGKKISPDEEKILHEKFKSALGEVRLQNIIGKIATATHPADIELKDYGAAMIIAFELERSRVEMVGVKNANAEKLVLEKAKEK